eukprot:15367017-Ditylum_brightwellii.AAC.1
MISAPGQIHKKGSLFKLKKQQQISAQLVLLALLGKSREIGREGEREKEREKERERENEGQQMQEWFHCLHRYHTSPPSYMPFNTIKTVAMNWYGAFNDIKKA